MTYIRPDAGFERMLEGIPQTIEEALGIAVAEGRMTIKEAEDCKEAYFNTFHRTRFLDSPPNQMTDAQASLTFYED